MAAGSACVNGGASARVWRQGDAGDPAGFLAVDPRGRVSGVARQADEVERFKAGCHGSHVAGVRSGEAETDFVAGVGVDGRAHCGGELAAVLVRQVPGHAERAGLR